MMIMVIMLEMLFRYCQANHNTVLYQRLQMKLSACVADTAYGNAGAVPDVAIGAANRGMGESSIPAVDLYLGGPGFTITAWETWE